VGIQSARAAQAEASALERMELLAPMAIDRARRFLDAGASLIMIESEGSPRA